MPVAIITQHFFNPANVGEVSNADGIGVAGSFACGATLKISLAVAESQEISAAKFKCAGCSYLVAACSILTDLVKGKTTGEAAALLRPPLSNIPDLAACARKKSNVWSWRCKACSRRSETTATPSVRIGQETTP